MQGLAGSSSLGAEFTNYLLTIKLVLFTFSDFAIEESICFVSIDTIPELRHFRKEDIQNCMCYAMVMMNGYDESLYALALENCCGF